MTPCPVARAEIETATTPQVAYAFIADFHNHWRFDDPYLRLEALPEGDREGRIRIRTPFGLSCVALTNLTNCIEPSLITGFAAVGSRTRAQVSWKIQGSAHGTTILLDADLVTADPLNSAVLRLGGGWWIRRRFERVLVRLVQLLDSSDSEPHTVSA